MAMERVHIWLGNFSSHDALEDYLEEHYDEDDDEQPINQFAADQGETFYDHDWVEAGFKEVEDINGLIKGHSYSDIYSEEVLEKAKSLEIKTANTFIMADSGEFSTPQSKQAETYSLYYLGRFRAYVKP